MKTVQPHINAIIDQRYAEAVLEAIEIDKRVHHELCGNDPLISELSIYNQPLLGIPFSCKDSISIEGMAFDGGLVDRKGVNAKEDASVIALLREAGAIPIVLTNIPEIIMWWDAYNKLYGRTNNPYDLSCIPGGSSGGEGALLASAGSVVGVGSDIGGSIRMPAFFCGIFGHKPTPGVVPTDGQFPEMTPEKSPFLCIGPMTRYAIDILPMLKVMAAPNLRKLKLQEKVDLSKIKIYFMEEDGNPFNTSVTADIKHSINKIIAHMTQKYGNYSRKVQLDKFSNGWLIWFYSLKQAKVPSIETQLTQGKSYNVFSEIIKYFLNMSKHTLSLIVFTALEKITPEASSEFGQKYVRLGRELKQEFKQLLGEKEIEKYFLMNYKKVNYI
jgi:fatty acid amide hydrolase 2